MGRMAPERGSIPRRPSDDGKGDDHRQRSTGRTKLMTTHDQIPPPPESSVRLRTPRKAEHGRARGTAMTVEKAPPAAGDRDELRRALLRAQPWGRILAQLTAI